MIKSSVPIMLVEDEEVDVMSLKRAFKRNNITNPLYVANNGKQALDRLLGQHGEKQLSPLPKILILDINMPIMNGLELLQAIREHQQLKSMQVFFLTTSDQESDKLQAYELNAAGYIVKPVDFDSFNQAVAELNEYWKLIEMPS